MGKEMWPEMRIPVELPAVVNGLKVEGLRYQMKGGLGERHVDEQL